MLVDISYMVLCGSDVSVIQAGPNFGGGILEVARR